MTYRLMTSLFLAVLVTGAAIAQPQGGSLEISKSSIDAGGAVSSGGEFSISGTIGQFDADTKSSHSGAHVIAGGFWALATDILFGNGFENE